MSRSIRLTQIHAINWFGYNDSLPINGHLLLAGVTGSGKSVLMDLIQLVLVGSERALFNRSATGTTGDRTLKSYCLLDTKREENGQPQYVRARGAISYVAMEFTWPGKEGEARRIETWGMRIEFRNAAENHGHIRPFYCEHSLKKADFLDDGRRPLEAVAFKRFLEKDGDGRVFDTQDQYLRDMANERHLNFNRHVLATLLPMAMSFTNRKNFDSFIREFVLPGDKLQTGDVVASYRNFLAYERDLRDLREQLNCLTEICGLFAQRTQAIRDRRIAKWLASELAEKHAAAIVAERQSGLNQLKAESAKEEARIAELDAWIPRRGSEIEQALAAIHQMPGGADYLGIKAGNQRLVADIQALKEIGNTLESALRARVKNARSWLALVQNARLPASVKTDGLTLAIQQLESCEMDRSEAALRVLADSAEEVKAEIHRIIRPTREQLDDVRQRLGKLREEIMMLERGIPPGPRALLHALNAALPPRGSEPPAKQLRDLCEIVDEKWRAAAEVAFGRKFAVVVDPADYERSLKLYQEIRGECPQESLVNPTKALKLAKPVQRGSLAEKIRTEHPVAAAILRQLFGAAICVDKREDLARHEHAILPDGFTTRGPFVERRRHYDGLPFIGRRGLEQQLAIKRSQLRELEAEERRLRPVIEAADPLARGAEECFPAHVSLAVDLARVRELPGKEQELKANIARLNSIDRASFEEKEQALEKLKSDLKDWENERRDLLGRQKHRQIEFLNNVLQRERESLARAERDFLQVKNEIGDISPHAARLNEWRVEVTAAYPAFDTAADRFKELASQAATTEAAAWEKLKAARRELGMRYPKFNELVPENPSNDPWEKMLRQIGDAQIQEYQSKAETARKQWENLFRSQVLQKLHHALKGVADTVHLLNGYLKQQPIGKDRYEIQSRPNPEFKNYRELINLNAICHQDDLFFSSVNSDLRTALDHFLELLVQQPDSLEAARLLDYRHYLDYDLFVWDHDDPESKPVSVDRQSGKFSGGENQSPYFVAILASYLRAYRRHESRWNTPSLALVPIDEAFSKLSTERIAHCMDAIDRLGLQGVLSMSAGNIPAAFTKCDQIIIVSKHEERRTTGVHIRNVPVSILRESAEGREWMERHG